MSTYTIRLSDEDFELLVEVLEDAQDQGPVPNGWKSPELDSLTWKIVRLQPDD